MVKTKKLPCGRELALNSEKSLVLSNSDLNYFQDHLKSYLKENKLKYTETRWNIAKVILQANGHYDIQQYVELVNSFYPKIGSASVYRNVKTLCESGLIEESHRDKNGTQFFERKPPEHHDHIICVDCGEIFEYVNLKIEKIQEEITQKLNFKLESHRHLLHAKCELLQKKKKKSS